MEHFERLEQPERFTLFLTKGQRNKIDKKAREFQITRSEVIRRLIDDMENSKCLN